MIVDNGKRRSLVIAGVFEGTCGESEGVLSFIPNLFGKPAVTARGGLLDGDPVSLSIEAAPDGRFFTAKYRRIA